jgi:hypothetical protein
MIDAFKRNRRATTPKASRTGAQGTTRAPDGGFVQLVTICAILNVALDLARQPKIDSQTGSGVEGTLPSVSLFISGGSP